MAWLNAFFPAFNGKVYFDKYIKPTITNLYIYACLTGVGGAWGNLVYALPLERLVSLPIPCTIVHLEMINVYIALSLWKHNMAVICSLNSGLSWDPFLGTVARNIWIVTATHDIDLEVQHIPGKGNGLADALSRWYWGLVSHSTVSELLRSEWCSVSEEIVKLNHII